MVLMFCPAPPPTFIPILFITLVCFTSSNLYLCCFMVVDYLKSTKIYSTLKIKHKGKYPGDGNALQHCSLLCLNVLQHSVNMLCSIALNINVLQHLANMFFQHCSQCFATFGKHVLQHCSKCFATFGKHALQHCPQCFATFGKHALQHCPKCFATFGTCFAALFSMFCNIW